MPTPLTVTPVVAGTLIATAWVSLPGAIVPFIVSPTAYVGRGTKLGASVATPNALTAVPA